MSARDSKTQVILFAELAKTKPSGKGKDYPYSIKAADLDENWKRTTLVPPDSKSKASDLYEVKYEKDGTRITRIMPNGSKVGDLLYWDGKKWSVFASVTSNTLHVLGIKNNSLQWVETQDCP